MYLQAPRQRGRRGLRGLGQDDVSLLMMPNLFSGSPDLTGPQTASYSTAADCSLWDFFFNPSAWQACANTAAQSQISTVGTNAKTFGYTDPVVAAAQQSGAVQQAQVPADTANIAGYMGAGQVIYNPQNPQNQTALPTWVWVALAGGAALVLIEVLGSRFRYRS